MEINEQSGNDNRTYDYDIALSFAGENRDVVEEIAEILKRNGVAVFYDKYEEANLWGKNLYEHLAEVYSERAQYCIIFISEDYNKKIWTTHERKNAQERALKENREYILPVRIDDTEIPGLLTTIGYLDLRTSSPEQIADAAIEKLHPQEESIEKKLPKHLQVIKDQLSDRDFAIFKATYREATFQLSNIADILFEHIQIDLDNLFHEVGIQKNDFELSIEICNRLGLFLRTNVDGPSLKHPFVDFNSENGREYIVCLSKFGFSLYDAIYPKSIADKMIGRVIEGEDPATVIDDTVGKGNIDLAETVILDVNQSISDQDALNILESWMKMRDPLLNTQVIYLNKVDNELNLPIGTAKRLLGIAAQEAGYTMKNKGENTILFYENRSTMDGLI
jgi:hypothetical protein